MAIFRFSFVPRVAELFFTRDPDGSCLSQLRVLQALEWMCTGSLFTVSQLKKP